LESYRLSVELFQKDFSKKIGQPVAYWVQLALHDVLEKGTPKIKNLY